MRESVNIRAERLIVFSKSLRVQSLVPHCSAIQKKVAPCRGAVLTRMRPMGEWCQSIEKNSRHSLFRDIRVKKFLTLNLAYKPIEELY
jgi:hypothetical protein